MPRLIITPDMSADTWLGAAGCARGSQTWSGTTPAFEPNATSASTNTTSRAAGERREAPARRSANVVASGDGAISQNIGSSTTSPRCVIATYQSAACRVSGSSLSVSTRKYDATAINSHASTNVKMFPAAGTAH